MPSCDSVWPPSGQVSVGDQNGYRLQRLGFGRHLREVPDHADAVRDGVLACGVSPRYPRPSTFEDVDVGSVVVDQKRVCDVGPSLHVHVVFLDGLDRTLVGSGTCRMMLIELVGRQRTPMDALPFPCAPSGSRVYYCDAHISSSSSGSVAESGSSGGSSGFRSAGNTSLRPLPS